ncbi:toll/interleukin-1 receptor domain-containing protein [Haliscomenobacter sp.]|uniref:toll/interleukin-1 receptor domain-containing protein n=1 Tax=Haliscomenobacter sp. TaxID=2717303 RepID=UPI003BABF995
MAHNFFLSHYSRDKEIAEIIANALNRISLRQIMPWYSSDSSESGGLKPGNIWFTEILGKINQSRALVAVLTPNSIGRPWIYFESGIAQSLENCEIIPVCVGIIRDNIHPPLGMYQCYQLTDYRSLKEFIGKLLAKFEITFDEEMSKPVLEKAISDLAKVEFKEEGKTEEKSIDIQELLTDLKSHIDKRFVDMLDRQSNWSLDKSIAQNEEVAFEEIIYTITIIVNFPEYKGKRFLEVRIDDTVQDVLNSMYFLLKEYIEPFTYMEKWVLKNPKNNQRMILREIGRMVPAKHIFKQEIEWEAIKLKEEYKASSSKDIVRNQ